jgi:hypothetical protein
MGAASATSSADLTSHPLGLRAFDGIYHIFEGINCALGITVAAQSNDQARCNPKVIFCVPKRRNIEIVIGETLNAISIRYVYCTVAIEFGDTFKRSNHSSLLLKLLTVSFFELRRLTRDSFRLFYKSQLRVCSRMLRPSAKRLHQLGVDGDYTSIVPVSKRHDALLQLVDIGLIGWDMRSD